MIVNPVNITLQEWADVLVYDLSYFGLVPRLESDDWVEWGERVRESIARGQELPETRTFKNWRDWAQRVYEVLG